MRPRRCPRAANARQSLSGPSPVNMPGPAPSSSEHGNGQAACADARHGRRPSPSSTEPTVAALPPRACMAPSRPSPSGAGRWSPISARPRRGSRRYACLRGRFRRPDLGLAEDDGDADVRPSRRRIRPRRRLPRSVAVNDLAVDAAGAPPPSSTTIRPRGCPALLTSDNPAQGRQPPLGFCPRGRPYDTGTDMPRAPTSGTGVAPPPPQRSRPCRLRRPTTHRCEPAPPPPGRSAGHQSAPTREGRLVDMPAGGAGSVGPMSRRGKRKTTSMTAGYGCGSEIGGAAGDHLPSSPAALRISMARRRCGSSPPCVLHSLQYLLPLSLALRDTSRFLSCPVLVAAY